MTELPSTNSGRAGHRILVAMAMIGLSAVALSIRLPQLDRSLTEDLDHFYSFTDMMFSGGHFDYYATVAQREFTYAHLPLLPYLLAPLMWAFRQAGQPDLYSVKALIYAADLGPASFSISLRGKTACGALRLWRWPRCGFSHRGSSRRGASRVTAPLLQPCSPSSPS